MRHPFDDAIAKITCFLVGHDHHLIQMVCRDQTRWICRRCHAPFSDTLQDPLQQFRRRRGKLSNRRTNSDEELPF